MIRQPVGLLKSLVRSIGLVPERPPVVVPLKTTESLPPVAAKKQSPPLRYIVFSDTENDVSCIENTLRYVGILRGEDGLERDLQGIRIVHTGDLLDKRKPAPAVLSFWQNLQKQVLKRGGSVKLIAGNHEQEIWQRIRAGKKYPKAAGHVDRFDDFITQLDLFHIEGSILFIHGYPTLEFLQALLHFKQVTGQCPNDFNAEHYKKSFRSIHAIRQYAYVRQERKACYLLYDMADAIGYYKKRGRRISTLLKQLQIDTVVHGHRPQRSGVQADYEYAKWIPGIRMIGNDIRAKQRGIGATLLVASAGKDMDVMFVNRKTTTNKLRKRIKRLFSTSASACDDEQIGDAEKTAVRAVVNE